MAPLPCHLRDDRLEIGNLHIRFHRTKITADQNMEDSLSITNALRLDPLPSLKIFPSLDHRSSQKGQMSQGDVFWIEFKTTELYLVRIYVDGVNTITGRKSPIPNEQDYLIIADDQELTGYKSSPNSNVRFTCPPFSDRKTNASNRANIQFEVTPYESGRVITVWFKHRLPLVNSRKIPVRVPCFATLRQFKDCIKRRVDSIFHSEVSRQFRFLHETSTEGIASENRNKWVYLDELNDECSLENTNIVDGTEIEWLPLAVWIPGGTCVHPDIRWLYGRFRWTGILRDTCGSIGWYPQKTAVVNIILLNSAGTCDIFGHFDPECTDETDNVLNLSEHGFANVSKPSHEFRICAQDIRPRTRNTIS